MSASHPLQKRVTVDGYVARGGGSIRKLFEELVQGVFEPLSLVTCRIFCLKTFHVFWYNVEEGRSFGYKGVELESFNVG